MPILYPTNSAPMGRAVEMCHLERDCMKQKSPNFYAHTTNGIPRHIRGKRFGNVFRVYAVYGDVSKSADLEEMAQEIAIEMGVDRVEFSFSFGVSGVK